MISLPPQGSEAEHPHDQPVEHESSGGPAVTTVVASRDGQTVVIKRASTAQGREAVAREARVLALAHHPGVAEIAPSDDRDELVMPFIGNHTLATYPCRSPEHAAGLIASVAETVADLHHLGVVHGRITADHIVINREGHPILVGFGAATIAGGADYLAGAHGDADADTDTGATPTRAGDVAALGALLRWLLLEQPDREEFIPERRRRPGRVDAAARRSLLTLADHASADEPRARPGARRLSAAILTAVPKATLIASGVAPEAEPAPSPDAQSNHDASTIDRASAVAPATPRRRGALRGRGATAAIALLGITLLAFGGASLAHGERPELGPSAAPPITGAVPTSETRVPAVPPRPSTPTTPALLVMPAGIIEHRGRRYAIGEAGDQIVIGALACSNEAERVAVLRPASGEVFVFDAWAESKLERRATVATRVPAGSRWPVASDQCQPLAAQSPTNEIIPIPVPPPRSP